MAFAGCPSLGACPAGGQHDHGGSANYSLSADPINDSGAVQQGWRWCNKCMSITFSGNGGGHCSAGATHDFSGSGAYRLSMNAFTGDQLVALIKKFAPTVYFHPDESYLMSSVDWFLKQATLHVNGVVQPTPADGLVNHLPTDPSINADTVWLDAPDSVRGGNLDTAEALVRAKQLPGGQFTDLQFWFFYPYNGCGTAKAFPFKDSISLNPMGEHGGDWEHITLRIENQNLSLHSVYLSQHDGGVWLMSPGQDLEWQNGRIVIYSSRVGVGSMTIAG